MEMAFSLSLSANMDNIKYTFVGYLLRAWLYILQSHPQKREKKPHSFLYKFELITIPFD